MHSNILLLILGAQYFPVLANSSPESPIAEPCSPSMPNTLCINNHSSVMPFHFFRNSTDEYSATEVTDDPSFAQVAEADFLVFDRERGLKLLGPNPSNTYMFTIPGGHEGPVYLESHDVLLFSQLWRPDPHTPQIMVNLSQTPPTWSEFQSDPPVYAINGGTVRNGLIYWATTGGGFVNGTESRPGIFAVNFTTGKSEPLLNNYFGQYFNGLNDIAIDAKGDVWFTDTCKFPPRRGGRTTNLTCGDSAFTDYGWLTEANDRAPQFQTGVWRFRPSTGAVNMVEDSVDQPNGIGFSPDYKTLYVADSGAAGGTYQQEIEPPGIPVFNMTGKRNIYAYDVSRDSNSLRNRRVIYQTPNSFPDGLKVARNGYIVTAAGNGLDIMDEDGTILVRAQMNYTVLNFAWTGKNLDTIWSMGFDGVSEVKLNLPGPTIR